MIGGNEVFSLIDESQEATKSSMPPSIVIVARGESEYFLCDKDSKAVVLLDYDSVTDIVGELVKLLEPDQDNLPGINTSHLDHPGCDNELFSITGYRAYEWASEFFNSPEWRDEKEMVLVESGEARFLYEGDE